MIRQDIADKMFDVVLPDMGVHSMKQVVQMLARQAAFLTNMTECDVYDRLLEQERQAPSAVGGGIMISHIRLPHITEPMKIFVRLANAVDCDSLDGLPVDMVSLLISPEQDGALHLRRLSEISRMFREDDFRDLLRSADCLDAVKAILMGSQHEENVRGVAA